MLQATAWMNLEWIMLNHRRHPKLALTPNPAEPRCPRIPNWKPPVTPRPKVLNIKAAGLHKAIASLKDPEADVDTLSPKLYLGGQGQGHSEAICHLIVARVYLFSQWYFSFSDPTLASDIIIKTPTISWLFLPTWSSGRIFVFFMQVSCARLNSETTKVCNQKPNDTAAQSSGFLALWAFWYLHLSRLTAYKSSFPLTRKSSIPEPDPSKQEEQDVCGPWLVCHRHGNLTSVTFTREDIPSQRSQPESPHPVSWY